MKGGGAPRYCGRARKHLAGPERNPSAPFRGERDGPTPQAWEGEVGDGDARIPHLTPALSAPSPEGRRGRCFFLCRYRFAIK
jgi:hypothetical protein